MDRKKIQPHIQVRHSDVAAALPKKPGRVKKLTLATYHILVYLFALAGVFFIGAFMLSRLNLTNVKGGVDQRSYDFLLAAQTTTPKPSKVSLMDNPGLTDIQKTIDNLYGFKLEKEKRFCQVLAINQVAGQNAGEMAAVYKQTNSDDILAKMIDAAKQRIGQNQVFLDEAGKCDKLSATDSVPDITSQSLPHLNSTDVFPWTQDETWAVMRSAIIKDKDTIDKVAGLTGVDSRLLVSTMFAEQSRLFRTQRGIFKQYLAPLQVLATANQFSLGVMGVKPKTAVSIEDNLHDPSSVYYLGPELEHLLDFSSKNKDQERYNRLSNEKDHFYSYLYGALYIKQVEKQWADAGFPIFDRPEIVATLYNIGFAHSRPNANPQVGGSTININGIPYTYGSLAYEFYYSGSLADYFPLSPKPAIR